MLLLANITEHFQESNRCNVNFCFYTFFLQKKHTVHKEMCQQTTSERAQPLSSSTIEDRQSDAPSNSETGTSTASNDAWQQTRLWKIV